MVQIPNSATGAKNHKPNGGKAKANTTPHSNAKNFMNDARCLIRR
jgi:hypothetical protein